jgi:GlcNAc-PI de-N-acetylase
MTIDRLTLMAVHAHPNDECIGTGGVLSRHSDEGLHTVLVTATRGEEGEIVDPEMDPETVRPRLGDVRVERTSTSPPTWTLARIWRARLTPCAAIVLRSHWTGGTSAFHQTSSMRNSVASSLYALPPTCRCMATSRISLLACASRLSCYSTTSMILPTLRFSSM